MKCDEARAAYLTGHPSPEHVDHLSSCSACRSVEADLKATLSALNQDAVWEEPGPQLAASVVTLISGTSGDVRRPKSRSYRWLVAAAVTVAVIAAGSPPWGERGRGYQRGLLSDLLAWRSRSRR